MTELIEVTQKLLVPETKSGCCRAILRKVCCYTSQLRPRLTTHDKSRWEKFRDWARRKNKQKIDTTYQALLELYAQEDVIEKLLELQLEPEIEGSSREDLEFYIPQLLNFLLYGEYRLLEDLLKFVLEACRSSFSFSHRVLWFLNSTDFTALESTGIDSDQLYKSVQIASRGSHLVYLNPSPTITSLISSLGVKSMFDLEKEQEKREAISSVLNAYASSQDSRDLPRYLDTLSIPLQPFGGTEDGYLSTVSFVKSLTDIAVDLLTEPDKLETLQSRLKEVNKLLPAGVYLPFSHRDFRESAVLWLRTPEAKVFTTKERAPYLVMIEVFNPAEELRQLEREDLSAQSHVSKLSSAFAMTSVRPAASPHTQTLTDRDLEKILLEANEEILEERERVTIEPLSIQNSDPSASNHCQTIYLGSIRSSVEISNPKQDEDQTPVQLFPQTFSDLSLKIRKQSPFGMLRTWRLVSVIVKAGDDLRQEQLAMQLISLFDQIFKEANLSLWLRPYEILSTETNCGLVECVTDAMSIDSIKKALPPCHTSLKDYFELQFGPEKTKSYKRARKSFLQSLAGYSLVCYMLQIKDRHNGNILLDRSGHIVHIDFGFILSNSPGNMNFESAPFKLSQDFVEVLGGDRSSAFFEYRGLVVKGYKALRSSINKIVLLLEMLRTGVGSSLPCFVAGEDTIIALKTRLSPRPKMSDADCRDYMNSLIDESLLNWRTSWYDRYQYWCQNIF